VDSFIALSALINKTTLLLIMTSWQF